MEEPEENQIEEHPIEEAELPEITAEHLEEQIELVRELAQAVPPGFREAPLPNWKQILYSLLVFGVLFAVIFLLIFDRSRQQMIASMGEGWNSVYAERQIVIQRLPPPPPKAVQTRTVTPAGRVSIGAADEEPGGVLFLDKQPPGLGRQEEEAPSTQAVILAKNSFNEAAYNLLKAKSETAAELTGNNIAEFEFQDWRPVKDDPPEAWIDLVATRRSDGELVHLIWSVNTETERTAPLSQAARDLDSSR